ncbi:MAG TPA: Na(+)-translocating NADH-quinone reductase subunit A [Candidatus Omnitrophota bacterium]|nr:Na(+)-translocating NADH-quinone reductase subunit A [Candidatus Omnitrophota bacterium]
MGTFTLRKGRNIRIKGAARKEIVQLPLPKQIGIQPSDFKGLKLRPVVKIGDRVKVGSPLLEDKIRPEIRIASPASGTVAAINRGEKRALLSVVVETDGKQEQEAFEKIPGLPSHLSREDVIRILLHGNLWPVIRQRPFSKVADPHDTPKSIFIHAMNTEPLAPDLDVILEGQQPAFQVGLHILKKLTDGELHLCTSGEAKSKTLTQASGVQKHSFSGPHPAGNVSTHIHWVDPISKGDIVWYIEAADVLRVARLFLEGVHVSNRIVAVTGEGAQGHHCYANTVIGAPVRSLLGGHIPSGMRCLSGSVLAGKDVSEEGFVRFYDAQVTIIPEGGKREFLGWLSPGINKYSFSRLFVSSFLRESERSLDSDKHGSDRAIVLNGIYDSLVPLDIMTYFLVRAVLAKDIEEAEALGILECDGEDFALCSFACPSKTDIGSIIDDGLALIDKDE